MLCTMASTLRGPALQNPYKGKMSSDVFGYNMTVVVVILAFVLSLLPPVSIFLWLRNRKGGDEEYRSFCNRALVRGAVWTPLTLLAVLVPFYGMELLMTHSGVNSTAVTLYHNFIVAALAEEGVKYASLRRLLKKHPYPCSELDVISAMMIIGIGFGLVEAVFYAFSFNPGEMIARGITAMHCGYGFIMGFFVSKSMKTEREGYTVPGILIPFLMHGAYDSGLSTVLGEISEYFSIVSVALALVGIITLVVAIAYVRKAEKKAEHTEAIPAENSRQ